MENLQKEIESLKETKEALDKKVRVNGLLLRYQTFDSFIFREFNDFLPLLTA